MVSVGLFSTSLTGLQAGIEQAQQAANEITRSGTQSARGNSDLASLTEASVDLLEAKLQTQASSNVLKTADEIAGTLIDTFV